MRKILLAPIVLCAVLLFGCGDSPKPNEGNLGTTAPINNDAPEAKNAPAAPRDPSIMMPGGNGGKKGGAPKPPGG